jgi:uroporphyrinogen-III synthase
MRTRGSLLTLLALFIMDSQSCTVHPKQGTTAARRRTSLALEHHHSTTIIALTREEGKNGKLERELREALGKGNDDDTVQLEELPCIAHRDGNDFNRLESTLRDGAWDYIAVTSPEAARVLSTAWNNVLKQNDDVKMPKVAVVGKATQAALEKLDIPVDFCPSKATAMTLVTELPTISESGTTVLYPASAKAATVLQDGLTERGFVVRRLDTYDTTTAVWTQEQKELGSTVAIACFGSPSAVKGWLSNVDNDKGGASKRNVLAACIGETSATACRELNFDESNIFYPENPGMPGWAQAVKDALESLPSHAPSTQV